MNDDNRQITKPNISEIDINPYPTNPDGTMPYPYTKEELEQKEQRAKATEKKDIGKKVVALTLTSVLGLSGLGVVAGGEIIKNIDRSLHPDMMSEAKQGIIVEPGDTVEGLIRKYVDGFAEHRDEFDIRQITTLIYNDPANQEALKNGVLNPGATIHIPRAVVPKK